jgi:hypothetical protein
VLAGNSDAASGFITADDANGGQAWDSNGTYYKASLMPSLPYAASAGQSIVKTISTSHSGDCSTTGCVQGAAVLTVVASSPANNGATVFRPPFVGSAKPLFTTSALDAQLPNLPRLSSTTTIDASLPTLSDEAAVMQGPDPGYSVEEWPGFHARANILPPNGSTTYSFGGDSSSGDTYEPGNTALYTDAIFRAVIAKSGDNETTRRQLVINMVQRGIDIYGEANAGMHWYAAGGHNLGPRIMLGFSAWMLNNDSTLAAPLASDNGQYNFAESGDLRPNRVSGGQPLHGQLFCTHGATCEASYWAVQSGQIDNQNDYDPYGYIDGGYVPSGSYEECCMSSALADEAMAVKLLPGMSTIWNNTMITKFANRWENHGLWTQPDPCAPLSQGGGPDSSHPGQCILDPDLTAGSTFTNFSCQAGKQCGRYPSIDGQSYHNTGLAPGGGGYSGDWGYTPLMHAIWNQYGPS